MVHLWIARRLLFRRGGDRIKEVNMRGKCKFFGFILANLDGLCYNVSVRRRRIDFRVENVAREFTKEGGKCLHCEKK